MTVREARTGDLDGVLALIRATPDLPQWNREALAPVERDRSSQIGPLRSLFVLEIDGALAGFAQTSVLLDEAELESIAVSASMQRRGLGRLLLEHAMRAAREDGATTFRLEVRESNRAALRLYASAGLTVVGKRRDYYVGPVEGAVLMQRVWPAGLSDTQQS